MSTCFLDTPPQLLPVATSQMRNIFGFGTPPPSACVGLDNPLLLPRVERPRPDNCGPRSQQASRGAAVGAQIDVSLSNSWVRLQNILLFRDLSDRARGSLALNPNLAHRCSPHARRVTVIQRSSYRQPGVAYF